MTCLDDAVWMHHFAALAVGVVRRAVLLFIFALFSAEATSHAAAQASANPPKVRVIGLGGTISYVPSPAGGYTMKTVQEVVSSVPELQQYATIETEQFANVFSTSITPADWLRLAQRINRLFREEPDLTGIVITHGTATLEELAFFLYLTVRSDRPVVLVAAQRGPTLASPDGPGNLLAGVRVAASQSARGKGAVVVMDDRILSARDVKKFYARTGGFDTGEMGMLGVISAQAVEFFYAPARKHTAASDFDVSSLSSLPSVAVAYSYSGSSGAATEGASGVVVASTGFTPAEQKYYEELRKKGVVVAVAFPSGEDVNVIEASPDGVPPIIRASHLTPAKARVLLMLALTKTREPVAIQKIFDSY